MSAYMLIDEQTTDRGYTILAYNGKDEELLILYYFTPKSQLVNAVVTVATSKTTIEELDQHIQKNYLFVYEMEGTKMYMSEDGETTVFLSENSSTGQFLIDYNSTDYLQGEDEPTPTIPYFDEPYTQWDASPNAVKSEMALRGYTLYDEGTNSSGLRYLAYLGKNKEATSSTLNRF